MPCYSISESLPTCKFAACLSAAHCLYSLYGSGLCMSWAAIALGAQLPWMHALAGYTWQWKQWHERLQQASGHLLAKISSAINVCAVSHYLSGIDTPPHSQVLSSHYCLYCGYMVPQHS